MKSEENDLLLFKGALFELAEEVVVAETLQDEAHMSLVVLKIKMSRYLTTK